MKHSKVLFYPCSGFDLATPLKQEVNEFWFVDVAYNLELPSLLMSAKLEYPSYISHIKSSNDNSVYDNYKFVRREKISENLIKEFYSYKNTTITIYFSNSDGMKVFREHFIYPRKFIDIFFYRGDSQGEGGSNFYWLNTENFNLILKQFKPKAVLISDLSNHDETVYDLLNKETPVNYNNKIINPKKELEERGIMTYSWEIIDSAPKRRVSR